MSRFVLPVQSVFDKNGHPLDGAKLYFYETDGVTPKNTYSDSALTTPNANPVVANNQGQFADIFLATGDYEVNLTDKDDVTQPNYPADPVSDVTGLITALLADLADTSNVAKGDALIGVKKTSASAEATTQHNVNEFRVRTLGVDYGVGLSTTNGTDDWSAAKDNLLADLVTAGGGVMRLEAGTYAMDEITLPTQCYIEGAGRGATKIIITGDGGGAPSSGSNGGVKLFQSLQGIRNITLSYNNALLQCLLNCSGDTGRHHLEDVDLYIENTLATTDVDCIASYLADLTEFTWINGQIGILPNFKQDMVVRGYFNACSVKGVTLRPHAEDLPNSVYHSINHLLDINASTQGTRFDNINFEQGPNGCKNVGQGSITFDSCYHADGNQAVNLWLPNYTLSLGDFIYPSAVVTGDALATSADLSNVSSTTDLFKGQKIVVIGAGAAGADLDTRITAISGTTVTMADTASTTVVTTGIYYPDYVGHGYMASVAGTTGSSLPTFPTSLGGTIVDGTVTLKEYGPCAWYDFNTVGGLTGKSSTVMVNPYLAVNVVGICAIRTGASPGAIKVVGGHFQQLDICGLFDGIGAVDITGADIDAYDAFGFHFSSAISGGSCRQNLIGSNYWHNVSNGADVVAHPTSNNLGGILIGSGELTGGGASKFHKIDTINPNPVARFAGYMETVFEDRVTFGNGTLIIVGSGSPEGVETAPVSSTFHRSDGGAGTSYYVKESGTGNTGWVAK